jgi:hypothetical protein
MTAVMRAAEPPQQLRAPAVLGRGTCARTELER